MANFCHNCGHKVTAKQRFCSNCGGELVFDAHGEPVNKSGRDTDTSDNPGWVIFYQITLILNIIAGIYLYILIDNVSYALSTFIISLLALVLFLMIVNRSSKVPDMVVVYHIASFVASILAGVEANDSATLLGSILGSAIWGVIWINYFHKSKVKTFFSGN